MLRSSEVLLPCLQAPECVSIGSHFVDSDSGWTNEIIIYDCLNCDLKANCSSSFPFVSLMSIFLQEPLMW